MALEKENKMKITKTASGKKTIKMSESEWQSIGKKAGWIKKASDRAIEYLKSLIKEEIGHGNTNYYVTIEPGRGETYASGDPTMYFYGEYPKNSVNEGMQSRIVVDRFDSEDEAQAAIEKIKNEVGIDVEMQDSSGYVKQELPSSPPSWFDKADAGEAWSEDDY